MSKIRLIAELSIVAIIAFYLTKISNTLEQLKSVTQSLPGIEAVKPIPSADLELQEEAAHLHSLAEVNQHLLSSTENIKAQDLALAISEIDSWMIEPESEKPVKDVIDQKIDELRLKIVSEVKEISQKALEAPNGKEASKLLTNIGLLISLYPMSEKQQVIDQARQLTDQQRKLAVNLEGMKRLRYNKWAVIRIEQALKSYHKNSSLWSPKKENKALVDSLVKYLADVDPNLLDPIVLSLYTYAVETTRESISETDKITVAKNFTAPTIRRFSYEDF